MSILFVILPYIFKNTKYAQRSFLTIPYGVMSIISYISKNTDVRVELFDCNLYDDYLERFENLIQNNYYNTVGFSLMFDLSYKHLKPLTNIVKQNSYSSQIIVGGAAATPNYEQILKENLSIDAVCYGEGELPIKEYLLTGKFEKGWATRGQLNPVKYNLEILDDCIDIDYSYITSLQEYTDNIEEAYSPYNKGKGNKNQFIVVTSRGCPYQCIFCMNSLNPDKKVRYASVDALINHIDKLVTKYKMNVLTFYDDQILHNKVRALELFERLKKYKLRIEMPNGVSISYLDEQLIKTMREAGVDTLYLALESGSKDIIKLMKKPVNLDKAKDIVKLLRKYDYFIFVFLVIGIPGETDAHRQETIKYIEELKPDLISPKPASPIYGSALRKQCIEKGYIKEIPFGEFEMTDSIIKTEDNDPEEISKQIMLMNYKTNFVDNYRMSIGDYKIAKHYFEFVANKYPQESFAHYYLAKVSNLLYKQTLTPLKKEQFKKLGIK
jgi:anaerobic magnesium-protoporphyrin IX monomethyl ester cyclase